MILEADFRVIGLETSNPSLVYPPAVPEFPEFHLVDKDIRYLEPGEGGFALSWAFAMYRGNEIWANGRYDVHSFIGGTVQIPVARLPEGYAVDLDAIIAYECKYKGEGCGIEPRNEVGSAGNWHDTYIRFYRKDGILHDSRSTILDFDTSTVRRDLKKLFRRG